MNRQHIAAILVVCALALAVGAYILVSNEPEDKSTLRQEVKPPEETAAPPAWVGEKQESKPDYTPSETKAEPAPKPEKPAPTVVEVKEDKRITFTFVDSLASFFLDRFIPQDKNGKPATEATVKALSIYFGQEMKGFNVAGDDIGAARKSILDYAFSPKQIDLLYNMYTPLLMDTIVESASNDDRDYTVRGGKERRTLENVEISTMLRINAVRINRVAAMMRNIGEDPSITQTAGHYLQASSSVKRANEQLQNAISDGKPTSEASTRLKQAIMQREQIKKTIVEKMEPMCPNCTQSDLFYLARWSYRRVLGDPKKLESFTASSVVLKDLANRFREKADELDQ